jgi:hypothetical protein
MDNPSSSPALGFGASFESLATWGGLVELDRAFLRALRDAEPELHERLLTARAAPDSLDAKQEGELVVALGEPVEAFVAELFGVKAELAEVAAQTHAGRSSPSPPSPRPLPGGRRTDVPMRSTWRCAMPPGPR